MFDLVTGKESQITTRGQAFGVPEISGDRIVYAYHYYNTDIYMFEPVSHEVEAIQAIIAQVDVFEADGSIANHGIATSLRAFLYQAEDAIGRGDNTAAAKSLGNFMDHLQRKTPQHITESAAQILIDMSQAVISDLSS